jgi:nitrite reductase (NADH) large subunit
MSEPLVIVGNGMAATRLVDELTRRSLGRYSVIVIGSEPRLSYNRVLLSSLLAGEIDETALELKPPAWWGRHGITTLYGQSVVSVDRDRRMVVLGNGLRFSYSKLVLAIGSTPIKLKTPGMDLPGVFTFRDLGDVQTMRATIHAGARAAVIGGGLLGIEAACGLAKQGVKVTLVHLMDRLMERQLDARAAALLKRAIEAKGVDVLLDAETTRIVGSDRVCGLEFGDGRGSGVDFVVCSAGIRARTGLAADAGLVVDRGIVVDDELATSDPDIFALGECAEHRGIVYGLVEPAYEQAKVLSRILAGDRTARYMGSALATNLKVSGVNVFSAGEFQDGTEADVITLEDEGIGTYKKLVVRDDKLVGAVLFGDTADAPWYLELIRSRADTSDLRDLLAFGPALALPRAA